jgi:alkyl hydroperoxide reductase subunit AhpC
MTTLCLDLALENSSRLELHEWLGGNWALLFSNPEDFPPQCLQQGRPPGREKDHWLDALRHEFRSRSLNAVAVKRDGTPELSWIDELHSDRQSIRLSEPPFAAGDELSLAVRALRGELLTLQSRFVLFIDGCLKRRGVLKYTVGRHSVSALDLLASVDALRSRRLMGRAA